MKPIRKCVSCREHKEKSEFLRVVKHKTNGVQIDFDMKKEGRGAYICCDEKCVEKAMKSRALSRAFKTEVKEDVYLDIMQKIKEKIFE